MTALFHARLAFLAGLVAAALLLFWLEAIRRRG